MMRFRSGTMMKKPMGSSLKYANHIRLRSMMGRMVSAIWRASSEDIDCTPVKSAHALLYIVRTFSTAEYKSSLPMGAKR